MATFTKRRVDGGFVIVHQGKVQTQYAGAGQKGLIPTEAEADRYLAAAAATAALFIKASD